MVEMAKFSIVLRVLYYYYTLMQAYIIKSRLKHYLTTIQSNF
jgi:hypothetical protein